MLRDLFFGFKSEVEQIDYACAFRVKHKCLGLATSAGNEKGRAIVLGRQLPGVMACYAVSKIGAPLVMTRVCS